MSHQCWEDMDIPTLEREYSPSSCVPDIMPFLRAYEKRSLAAKIDHADRLREDLRYGPEPRAMMDIFIPDGDGPFPVHVFIHGGYWQELSKNESCFAAPNFLAHDMVFIALDYTLAPDYNLPQIIEQTRRGMISILKNARKFSGNPANISLSGSSAGAHLVAEILSSDWPALGYAACPLKAALAMSGIYDLRPLVNTYINEPLRMDQAQATACSPLFRIPARSCPLIISYGENETAEFKRQSHDYHDAWLERGLDAKLLPVPGVNHFDIVMELTRPDSPLFQTLLSRVRA
tara:strand:+ start:8545 stop:9414 length:870 start_codon:yes stop_codon:yes gene_type:complete